MPAALTSTEEAQLSQTIEMFEVITQSQPLDCQSLEILKEAYWKVGKHKDAVRTSKRIADAYLGLGQLSSAILEYEGILQRFPDDPEVRTALAEIEQKAKKLEAPRNGSETETAALPTPPPRVVAARIETRPTPAHVDDGRKAMEKMFVEGRIISAADFNASWPTVDLHHPPKQPNDPFIQVIAEKQMVPVDVSLKLLLEKTRLCFLPLERYDIDVDLARSMPRDLCLRWCVLPFDRMSKSILVATSNPFNKHVVQELESFAKTRLLWYLASPIELVKALRKTFR
jgi:hypothetical protein